MNKSEEECLRKALSSCIGHALDALGEQIHELSCFCTMEEVNPEWREEIK